MIGRFEVVAGSGRVLVVEPGEILPTSASSLRYRG